MLAAIGCGIRLRLEVRRVQCSCNRERELWQDILEAFLAHPKIGDSKGAKEHGGKWASNEQSGMSKASSNTAAAMAQGNADYEAKMGFRYIVCATGKTAEEMLQILQARLVNAPENELINGAAEQNKITHLRLNKLLSEMTQASL
jgi:2-oxo-4-hydroxy-4-carboxy-5-ureidoimidazoline decarboxylase